MRRVRCPGCSAIIQATSEVVTCNQCGLTGRVDAETATKGQGSAKKTSGPERDPWQITIDLRSLNPARWPAGGRAFAVVMLIGLAFFAGGFAGITFERAKTDVLADLDDGVFGSGSGTSASNTEGAASPGGAAETTGTATTTATATNPPPSASTIRHDYTDADTDPVVTVKGGLVRVSILFDDQGTSSRFSLKFLQEGKVERSISASYPGKYEAVRYLEVPVGTYDLQVGGASDQSTWTMRIDEPRGDVANSRGGVFSEHGDNGVGPLKGSGDIEVSFAASKGAGGTVAVKAFRADGSQIKSCGTSFGSTTPDSQYSHSWTCAVGTETLVYFDIAHPLDKEDTWSLAVT